MQPSDPEPLSAPVTATADSAPQPTDPAAADALPEAAPEASTTEQAPAPEVAEPASDEPIAAATEVAGTTPAPQDLSPAQCSARLAELFPALFKLQQPKPLKLRIQADIQARAPGVFTRKSLSAFLHRYTTGTPYLLALTRETHRHDLDGQPAGELAAEHREAATAELARRRAIVDARRAAENAARREAEAAARQQREADQQGRRERAQLLRAFETSTLTRANFCALKGLADAELDGLLAQARQEAAERPPAFDDRPPRRDAAPRPGPRPGDAPGPRSGGPRERRGPPRRA